MLYQLLYHEVKVNENNSLEKDIKYRLVNSNKTYHANQSLLE
jgi:hypothetical protein